MKRRVLTGLLVAVALIAGCGSTDQSTKGSQVIGLLAGSPTHKVAPPTLLAPAQKYFGISMPGVPASVVPLQELGRQVGKEPNMVEFFSDWTHPFDVAGAQRLCNEGVVPVLTWESWSWEDLVNGAPAVSQPAYAPREIAAGVFDTYIKQTAQLVKSLHCQLIIRFDHEMNGRWYPWGVATAGMHNTAADYVAMWRHVWKVFHAQGVHNVKWMWSPNLLYPGGIDKLGALYPGSSYVNVVGLDSYLIPADRTLSSAFSPILAKLKKVAPTKPWIVAETGVASGARQAKGIARLLKMVASNPKLIGLIYLDESKSRADWRFTSPAAVKAVKVGVGSSTFGQAPAGIV